MRFPLTLSRRQLESACPQLCSSHALSDAVKGEVVNKGEFVQFVADRMGKPKTAAARCVDAVLECIKEAVRIEGRVALSGFGILERRTRKVRAGVNPVTLEPMTIKSHRTVGFKPSKQFKEMLSVPESPDHA